MKKLFLIIIALALSQTILFSQGCLPDGIHFLTQGEIDSVQINYPGCTEIEGDVLIQGEDITNLNGLNVITSIGGKLSIEFTDALISLSGLENLTSIQESLKIHLNNALVSMTALENLTFIGGNISISYNPALVSLSGLENLTEINGYLWISNNNELVSLTAMENITSVEGELAITANNALVSLIGLENITSIEGNLTIANNALVSLTGLGNLVSIGGSIRIQGNDSLTTLTGLENVTSIAGEIYIYDTKLVSLTGLENIDAGSIVNLSITYNSFLSSCNVQSICNYLVSPNGNILIIDNADGCNNYAEIEEACHNSIGEIVGKKEIKIFPNPATSFITIKIKEGIPIEEAIIYNHLGQKALVAKPVNSMVDVSGLKPGIYLVEVATKNWRGRTKLIIE